MADCTQKLQATISAAVESWQTGFNSLIVQRVRFLLEPTDVRPIAICLIWCRVVQSRDVRSRDFSAPFVAHIHRGMARLMGGLDEYVECGLQSPKVANRAQCGWQNLLMWPTPLPPRHAATYKTRMYWIRFPASVSCLPTNAKMTLNTNSNDALASHVWCRLVCRSKKHSWRRVACSNNRFRLQVHFSTHHYYDLLCFTHFLIWHLFIYYFSYLFNKKVVQKYTIMEWRK